MAQPAMTVQQLERFLAAEFSQAYHPQSGLTIEAVWQGGSRVRQAYRAQFIRPGGTISGPTMMALADFTMYVGLLASIGPVPLAVTTNLNIKFLRRPAQNAGPLAASTTARISRSAAMAMNASSNARSSASDRLLRAAGRLSVRIAT